MSKSKQKATRSDGPRCRFCYQVLTEPWCAECRETHSKANQILGIAHTLFRIRGTIFDSSFRISDAAE